MSRPSHPSRPSGAEWQVIANATQEAITGLLNDFLAIEAERLGFQAGMDAGAFLEGAVGGIVFFALQGDISDADLRSKFLATIDMILPQARMAIAAGGAEAGHA